MVTTPVRSSIQSAKDWPTPTTACPTPDTHALVLAIISSQAPLLDHPRFAVGKLVLHVDPPVLAYLEGRKITLPSTLQGARDFAVPPGDQHGLCYGPLPQYRIFPAVGLVLGKLYTV